MLLRLRYLLPAVCLTFIHPGPGLAEENWSLCRVPVIEFAATAQSDPAATPGLETADAAAPADADSSATRVEAQTVISETRDQLRFSGDVEVFRADERLSADDVVYDKNSDRLQAEGNVEFADSQYRINSPAIELDKRNDRGLFAEPDFELYDRHGRGSAGQIERIDEYRSRFYDLTYTTCDPEDRDWHMTASEMEIDDESGRGTATHTTLYFQEVPFLYFPYFQFPIDDRRMSGILTPRLGYSESDGGSLEVPVYLNLAPNYDMTVTPSWFDRRGVQLNTENRYLFSSSIGQVDLSYLDDDDVFGDNRWFQRWRHESILAYEVTGDLLLAEVSDGEIFDDFDNLAPEYNDTRHLERRLRFRRGGEIWSTQLLWQNFQTLDETRLPRQRPYNRLPRLTLEARPQPWQYDIKTPLDIELVEFDRDDSVTGRRNSLVTSFSRRAEESWYFFEPELQLSFTDYDLDNNDSGDNSIQRSLPTFSLDTGLIFERDAGSQAQWLQTLEPRLYFLHTPFEDQDDIPDFDTKRAANTYGNLFRNNRFIGGDRIGDATQVTFGLASRIFTTDTGAELMQVRAGQIYYFEDRRVSLNGVREEEEKSDVIGELDLWPNERVRVATRLVFDQEDDDIIERDFSINYANEGYAANLGYYFEENDLEQALVSMAYPISERWSIFALAHRSLLFERTVENLLGFSYESCCWGFKILARQNGDDDENFAETENSIYFELTLKGLSDAGQDIDSRLNSAIPGYRPEF